MTSLVKSFKALLLLKSLSAGDLFSAVNALGNSKNFEIFDIHHLANSSNGLLAFTDPIEPNEIKNIISTFNIQMAVIDEPHAEFLEHYLHLKLADEIQGSVTVVESSDYIEFFQCLDLSLKNHAQVLDLFWSRAGLPQGFFVLTGDSSRDFLQTSTTTKVTHLNTLSHPISCFLTGKKQPHPDIS